MSDIPTDIETPDDTAAIGQTSADTEPSTQDSSGQRWYQLDLFNTLLLISLVLITLSSLRLMWHLIDQFGWPTSLPWNV